MNEVNYTAHNSTGWMFFVKSCFGLAVAAMALAIVFAPTQIWVKGYLAMGSLLLMASSFMLSKSVRDDFEAQKAVNRIADAKTEQMLRDFERVS